MKDRPAGVRPGEELLDRRVRQLRPEAEADGLPHIGRDPHRERGGKDRTGAS